MNKIIAVLFVLISLPVISQGSEEKKKEGNKGKMFLVWGWNRASFSDSDIQFKGDNYDFMLQDVKAKDRITPFSFKKYINPANISIPQNNYRIGYFFRDNYTVSIGNDHMKYVMTNYQTVKIDGTINAGNQYDGSYDNDDILLTHEFLTFEHTDGLNFVNVEVNRFDSLNKLLKINNDDFEFNLTEGIGVGILYPKTNTTLFGGDRYDEFHVAGYGLSANVGLNITFFKYFFVQSDLKVGYINMDNIRTTTNSSDFASQHFTFFEKTIVVGTRFQLSKK
jgi:hypothetical protein